MGGLFLSLLLSVPILVSGLAVSGFVGSKLLLTILDFTDGVLSKSLLFFGTGSFHLADVVKGHTLNGALLLEDLLLLLFVGIGLL